MADKRISALPGASTPLAGTEVLPIVQGGDTVKVAVDDLTVKNIRSNATTGLLQVAGPAAASTRVVTVPDANATMARTDAAQTFAGIQSFSNTTDATSTTAAALKTAGGLAVAKKAFIGNEMQMAGTQISGISSTATNISADCTYGGLVIVNGINTDTFADIFTDLVFVALGSATALSSKAVVGTPSVRVYSAPAGVLQVSFVAGTYQVRATAITGLNA